MSGARQADCTAAWPWNVRGFQKRHNERVRPPKLGSKLRLEVLSSAPGTT